MAVTVSNIKYFLVVLVGSPGLLWGRIWLHAKASQSKQPLSWCQRATLQLSWWGFIPRRESQSLDVPLIGCHAHYLSWSQTWVLCHLCSKHQQRLCWERLFLPPGHVPPCRSHSGGLLPSSSARGFGLTQTPSLYNVQTEQTPCWESPRA